MKILTHSWFVILVLICISQIGKSQCSLFYFFTNDYDCVNNQSSTSFTINGATAPYTCTFVNVANSATVATGATIGNTGTVTSIPVGNFSVFITSANNCTAFTLFSVTLPFSASNIVFTNTNVSCFNGNNGVSSANVNNSFFLSPYTFSWSTGATTQAATNLIANTAYSVTITDSKGCMVTNSVILSEPAQIASAFSSTFIPCYGTSINTGFISTGGTPAFSYSVDGIACAGNTASNLFAGTHTIVTKDSKGCIITNTDVITQVVQPIITFSITKPSCPGKSDGAVSASVSAAPSPFTYTWQPVTSNLATLSNIPIGNYTLTVKDVSACITKSVAVVLPAASMTINVITKPENCSAVDGAATVNISGGNLPFNYTTQPIVGPHTTNTINLLSTGTYTTIIKDANNCLDTVKFSIGNLSTVTLSIVSSTPVLCYNQCTGSIQLNAQNAVLPITYSVSNTPTTTSNIISNLCSGFYTIKAIDAIGCPATTTINFSSPPVFSYSASAPSSICSGKSALLQAFATGGTGSHNYVWQPGTINGQTVSVTPSSTTVYSLNVYDVNGCTLAPYQLTLNVNALIAININTLNVGICPGTTAQITPTITGGDGLYTYNWQPGNLNVPAIFVQNASIPFYTLTVNDACGSPTAVKIIPINLFSTSKPTFTVINKSGCEPFCTQFINTTPKSSNIIWNYGDKPSEQPGNTTNYCYQKAGVYNIRLTLNDSNNCKTSYTYTNVITVFAKPLADFVTNPKIVTLNNGQDVLLENSSVNGDTFNWSVNDLQMGQTKDIRYSFSDTGCYLITLSAKNSNNCVDTNHKYICVAQGFNFYVPNCITLNHDNLNDILLPYGTGWMTKDYLFEIYNRWGYKIFKTTDYTVGWDGATKGVSDPLDVYFWRIIVTDNIGELHELKGYVTVLK